MIAIASNQLIDEIKGLLNECIKQGRFPSIWKNFGLILIPMPGKIDWTAHSSYRPICLISELGKMFEKIMADRIVNYLSQACPDLSPNQFGFTTGRSAVDAIDKVMASALGIENGGVALAVSLDIANTFNSLP